MTTQARLFSVLAACFVFAIVAAPVLSQAAHMVA